MIMKMTKFRKKKDLIMKILSQVSYLCHFILILSNHNDIPRISNFAGENIYLPFMRFL